MAGFTLASALCGLANGPAMLVATRVLHLLVPRFGRKVLQAGAVVMAVGVLLFVWEDNRYGTGIHPWQVALPLAVMGLGMASGARERHDRKRCVGRRDRAGAVALNVPLVRQAWTVKLSTAGVQPYRHGLRSPGSGSHRR